jgi:hypothetical protein
VLGNATTSYTTLPKLTKCLQESIKADIKTLAAYLVKESVTTLAKVLRFDLNSLAN